MQHVKAIVLDSAQDCNFIEILSDQGLRHRCFVKQNISKVLSRGTLANFLIVQTPGQEFVCEVAVISYPKITAIEDIGLVHGLLKNFVNLLQLGSCEPEIYELILFFLSSCHKIQCFENKKIFFRATMLGALLQFGFLGPEYASASEDLYGRMRDYLASGQSNFQIGFTTLEFDEKIRSGEVLSCALKEFNLNLHIV